MIRIKDGVEFTVIAPAGFLILQALKLASSRLSVDLTITSACDGVHSGPADPHHTGEAYDIRSHDFPAALRPTVLVSILAGLDPVHFFGFLEAPGTDNEHFHFQRAKGTTFSVMDLLAI
jgi:hypothetical protein